MVVRAQHQARLAPLEVQFRARAGATQIGACGQYQAGEVRDPAFNFDTGRSLLNCVFQGSSIVDRERGIIHRNPL
ncbi:MAG TPA: hypothetical protein VGW37_14440 [Terriglobia bacterium]|nr:hypothetical protein [Terriglobia bacterium]